MDRTAVEKYKDRVILLLALLAAASDSGRRMRRRRQSCSRGWRRRSCGFTYSLTATARRIRG